MRCRLYRAINRLIGWTNWYYAEDHVGSWYTVEGKLRCKRIPLGTYSLRHRSWNLREDATQTEHFMAKEKKR